MVNPYKIIYSDIAKYIASLAILLLISTGDLKAQDVSYEYLKVIDESLVYERVFNADTGYIKALELQIKSMPGIERYEVKDSVITFHQPRSIPQENEIENIKKVDKGYQKLRINAFSYSAIIYLKSNRYKVVLNNIKDYYGAENRFGKLTDATLTLYSPKNKRFRKWSHQSGITMEHYFSYQFELRPKHVNGDW